MIGFYRVVRVLLDVTPRGGNQLIQYGGVDGGGVGDHFAGVTFNVARGRPKNRRAVSASRRAETSTSMTSGTLLMARA